MRFDGAARVVLLGVLSAMLVTACSDEAPPADPTSSAGTGGDAGSGGTGGSGGSGAGVVTHPQAPAPPQLVDWTCPAGWSTEPVLEGTPEEISICAPPPLPLDCPAGTMPVVGEASCQSIGDPCPAGAWPEGLPATGVVYVQPGGAGDGSSTASPLASIQAAIDAAPAGGVIALAKGTYPEAVVLDEDLTVWGACAGAVTLEVAAGLDSGAAIDVTASAMVELRNLTILGPLPGVAVSSGAAVTASGIQVLGAADSAFYVLGSLQAELIHAAGTTAGSSAAGHAIEVLGGEATIARSSFENNTSATILATGATLSLSDVLIRSTLAESDGTRGYGIRLNPGTQAEVARTMVIDSRRAGIYLDGADLDLVDSTIRDTHSQESDGYFGYGLSLHHGAVTRAERLLAEGNRTGAMNAFDDGTTLEAVDVVSRGTLPQEVDDQWGGGIAAVDGGTVTLARAIIYDNHATGCETEGAGSLLQLSDSVVATTRSEQSNTGRGHGLEADSGSRMDLSRVVVDQNRTFGIVAEEATVNLSDVTVRKTLPNEGDGTWGVGIALTEGSHGTMVSSLVTDSFVAGVVVKNGSDMSITTSEVVRTLPSGNSAAHVDIADGIAVVAASATLDGVRVAECQRAGLLFAESVGSMTSVVSTDNSFGLVLQGSSKPTYDEATCDFSGSSEPVMTDLLLPFP